MTQKREIKWSTNLIFFFVLPHFYLHFSRILLSLSVFREMTLKKETTLPSSNKFKNVKPRGDK